MPVKLTEITIAHSPDSDDAFMFYALAKKKIDTRGITIHQAMKDIQTLNQEALKGTYEVSAISFGVYPEIADTYALMPCGSSMGENYGPLIVAKKSFSQEDLKKITVAVPGKQTSAYLTMQLYQPGISVVFKPFDQILDAVVSGEVDAGLLIHEGQLTYSTLGLQKIVDLGEWWHKETNLPLPLGGNAVRKNLGPELMIEATRIFKESVVYSLEHREEALEYALSFARDMQKDLADKYVGMYVNQRSVDFGEDGRKAIRLLFEMAHEKGILKNKVNLEFSE